MSRWLPLTAALSAFALPSLALAQDATEQTTDAPSADETVEEPPAEAPEAEASEAEAPEAEAPEAEAPEAEATGEAVESTEAPEEPEAPAEAETPEAPEADGEAEGDDPWNKVGWGWGALPAVNYNSDNGFGYGLLASIYRYDGSTGPYKMGTTLLIYFTTKGVQTHRVDMDVLDVGGLPLRLTGRVEFSVSKTDNFCGFGPAETCLDDANGDGLDDTAVAQADAQGVVDDPTTEDVDEYAQFLRRYYQSRNIRPNGFLNARYTLGRGSDREVDVFASWWGSYSVTGGFTFKDGVEPGPYTGSLYEQTFGAGEEGFMSTVQAGVMLDERDNEPAPIKGYWVEASVRGAGPWIGSNWSYFGFNTTLRGYVPLLPNESLVLADRLVLDGIVGDPPTFEMARAGGADIYTFFGGQRAGRGVRSTGVIGRVRAMNQTELRWTVLSPNFGGKLQLDVTPVAFYDQGYWASEWSDIGGGNEGYVWGTGGGLRLAFNKNFIIRADVGVSPREDFGTGVYIDIKNLW